MIQKGFSEDWREETQGGKKRKEERKRKERVVHRVVKVGRILGSH